MPSPNKVVLVDDHDIVRAGIRSLINEIHNVAVVGETGEGSETLSLVKSLQPQLVILDISLKGLNGIDVLGLIKKHDDKIKVLMLSMHDNVEYTARCLRKGAQGYLLKDSAGEELEIAIYKTLGGHTYVSQDIDKTLLTKLMSDQAPLGSALETLTPRQRHVLQLICEGYSTRQIADKVNVSIKTVETHRAHIMNRLNIFDVAGLVKFAMKEQLIS